MKKQEQFIELLEILKKEYGITNMSQLSDRLKTLKSINLAPFCSINDEIPKKKEKTLCKTSEQICPQPTV